MSLPSRIRVEKCRHDPKVRSAAHLRWVRSHACSVRGCPGRPIEAAHVRVGSDGGTGMKPGDDWAISLCAKHHFIQHVRGEIDFGLSYRVDMKALAIEFARKSPVLRRRGIRR